MSKDHGRDYLGACKSSPGISIGARRKDDDINFSRSTSPSSTMAQSYPERRSYFPHGNFGAVSRCNTVAQDQEEARIGNGRLRTSSCIESRDDCHRFVNTRKLGGFATLPEFNGSGRSSTASDTENASMVGAAAKSLSYETQRDDDNEDKSIDFAEMTQEINAIASYPQGSLPVAHYHGHRAFGDLITTIGFDNRWSPYGTTNPFPPTDTAVDSKAIEHRRSAIYAEPRCTWSGQLPARPYKNPTYSPKVFLGGVPWDITTEGLTEAFQQFGQIRVVYANDKMGERRSQHVGGQSPKQGYLYVVFESDKRIKELLAICTHDYSNGGKYYFNISSRRMRSKEVQVIPWVISDSNFVRCPSQRLDPSKTVFVGALHGMLTAEGLAHVCNDLFGGVAYVGIDTDKFKYPIGSGRVTFNNQKSYMKAVAAAFVDIKATRFTKKIQIDPYLENSLCSSCNMQPGPIFCRDTACFRYFCRSCWRWTHSTDDLQNHKPIMRNRRD